MEEVRPDYYRVAGKKTDDPTEDIRKAETYESML